MNTTKQLVNLVISGDMKAYEQLYEDSSKQVYYTCLSFLKNKQDSLDIMQDTYISALTHLKELQDKNRFSQWVNQIAVNKCKDYLIKKKPTPMDDEIMNQLPIEEAELMIAQCMDCPEGTVSYRLCVARSKIKEGVKKYEKTSGNKLYSVSGIPFLAAFFIAETKTLAVPNVLAAITGSAISTGTTSSLTGSLSTKAVTAGATASTATKAGLGAVFGTVKAKIAIGIASLAVIEGVTAGAIMMSKDDPKAPEPAVVYESEYISVEYVDVHYEDSRADKDYNGELMVTVTIENKTNEELIIDNFNYCVNHMSNIDSIRGALLPGENEIIFIIDLLGLKDEGSVDFL